MAQERIELFDVALLDEHRPIVKEMLAVRDQLKLILGWHYLLDLAWVAQYIQPKPGMTILDAGAGQGIFQWWATQHGADVISVDRTARPAFNHNATFHAWAPITGLRPQDAPTFDPEQADGPTWRDYMPPRYPWKLHRWPDKLKRAQAKAEQSVATAPPVPPAGRGKIMLYTQDLTHMPEVADGSVDAIVSISSLEHNEIEGTHAVYKELMRVLKPGGTFAVTVSALPEDTYHEAASGWCYSEATLKRIFEMPDSTPSNYGDFDTLFQKLKDSTELRDSLDPFYAKSGDNGMPWGKWNPQYHPVGVVKIKD